MDSRSKHRRITAGLLICMIEAVPLIIGFIFFGHQLLHILRRGRWRVFAGGELAPAMIAGGFLMGLTGVACYLFRFNAAYFIPPPMHPRGLLVIAVILMAFGGFFIVSGIIAELATEP